jgi:YebC/PmpR family DNA-binding regulatory protein
MSGHSKWSKIKHQKGTSDAKKGQVFSKLSRLIIVAAKKGADVDSNLDLRYAINKAKSVNMPSSTIERAIKKGTGELQGEKLEEARYEAFGPGSCSLVVDCITDNKNRTLNEIKIVLTKHSSKLGEPGSVMWAFESGAGEMKAKHTMSIPEDAKNQLTHLISDLEELDDILKVCTNVDEV